MHIHNLVIGSWHQQRQDVITQYIKEAKANTLADIGFGVPSRYLKEVILRNKTCKTTLCDLFDSAFDFASALLEQWDSKWQETISFRKADMNNAYEVGNFDIYLFQDSIEHVEDPTKCLKSYVNLSPKKAKFIFSLPIGPKIPVHYIAWQTDYEAKLWLQECGLKIIKETPVWVNPEVDLFAEPLGGEHHNLIVSCTKHE